MGVLVYNLLNEKIDFYTKQEAPLSLNSNPAIVFLVTGK